MVFMPLKWGVTIYRDRVGYCNFSVREIERQNRKDIDY